MRVRVAVIAVVLLFGVELPVAAQRPLAGIGVSAGTVLGSEWMKHDFDARIDGEDVTLTQEVDLRDVVVAGLHGEWYVTPHVALRGHIAWGSGELVASTYRDEAGDTEAGAFETGFGETGMLAVDGGISLWPWMPRSVGFAPYITIGYGVVDFDFSGLETGPDSFFRASGERSRNAILIGFGADMRIWRFVALRMEAMNHLVRSPLRQGDFADFGEDASSAGGITDRVSNIRLILGAHIYFPPGDGLAVVE